MVQPSIISYIAMMLKPQKNFLITGFLNGYIAWIVRRHFKKVHFNTPDFDSDQSILLIANHCSWWDGFILYHINRLYFKKKFHTMVLEETMQKVGIFKYLGGFSVAKNSKQVLEALSFAAGLLNDGNNMVVIFPQGKLHSNFVDEIGFEKGVFRIAAQAKPDFQYVFAASFTENFEHKKPSVFCSLTVFHSNDFTTLEELRKAYQQHYMAAKTTQTNITI